MQNLLHDQKVICYEENGTIQRIKWQYIEALNSVQEDLGFSLANMLKKQHIFWTKHKMNVRIAAQTLSSSVASTIDFLQEQTDLPEFKGSEPTTHFINQVDMIFDILNSRNPFAKGHKAPVTKENLSLYMDCIIFKAELSSNFSRNRKYFQLKTGICQLSNMASPCLKKMLTFIILCDVFGKILFFTILSIL